MPDSAGSLLIPALGGVYAVLAPWTEVLLRACVGLLLVPHGLRMTFGMFAGSGGPVCSLAMLAAQLDRDGYRRGAFWAPAIAATELVGGPLLAFGLFTRPAALAVFVFLAVSTVERYRVGGWFWNSLGMEYTLLWAIGALYFVAHGGGGLSLDTLVFGRFF
jgi:putative oxidoreductase